MFLPTTKEEMKRFGWEGLDVIIVTGDTYIDSPFIGAALIGKALWKEGFRVGIIAQPDLSDGRDMNRLGEPELFWGVTGGSVDSMIANYTATLKRRRDDDYTPGGVNNRRPDRAVIAYANLIRQHFKDTAPVILGGIEASLRRIAHYDYWSDSIRRSILFDARAEGLLYGMAERTVVELARRLQAGEDILTLPGFCHISRSCPEGALELPAFEEARRDPDRFTDMFRLFCDNNDPVTAQKLCQRHGDRYLVHNPPPAWESEEEMDRIYNMHYERNVHPRFAAEGPVRALDTIRFAIPTHRGCYGGCRFCAISIHEGRAVRSRSEASILNEARQLVRHRAFKGTIVDLCGPSANMYGTECRKMLNRGACTDKSCLFPDVCTSLNLDHSRQRKLPASLRALPGVKNVFVASGIRHDMILQDRREGLNYLRDLVRHHLSGQMKIAPEHTEEDVLALMGKPGGTESLAVFRKLFRNMTKEAGKEQHLTFYFMAAHPGCRDDHMALMADHVRDKLHIIPDEVQVFTPAPGTWSSVMYYTGKDPFTGEPLFVEKDRAGKDRQKEILTGPKQRPPAGGKAHRKKSAKTVR